MYQNLSQFPPEVSKQIVAAIQTAVEENVPVEISNANLSTNNSGPMRKWDHIFTQIEKSMEMLGCIVFHIHRGSLWNMVAVYEPTTKVVITFMRESRFGELREKRIKRTVMHYIDMFPKFFNKDLRADECQLSLYPHKFSNEDTLELEVMKLLVNANLDVDSIQGHATVLFETSGHNLTSVRAVMLTPTLEIASGQEVDWSKYLSMSTGITTTQIDMPSVADEQPTKTLPLTPKAMARKSAQ